MTGTVRTSYVTRVRTLWLRLALVERTDDYVQVARVAEQVALATGPLTEVTELAVLLAAARRCVSGGATPPHARVSWELRAWADVPGRDPEAVAPIHVTTR